MTLDDFSKVLDENGGQHYLTGYVEFDNPRKGKGGKGESAAAPAGTRDYARIDLACNRQVGALLKENVARLDDIVKENPAAFEDFFSYEVALLKIKLEAIAAGTFMQAPNGEDTNLTEQTTENPVATGKDGHFQNGSSPRRNRVFYQETSSLPAVCRERNACHREKGAS